MTILVTQRIPQEPFDAVCPPAAEQKKTAFLKRIKEKMILYNPGQAVYSETEICVAIR